MMKKKENIVIIILIVVMILAIIGVSYAAFSYSKTGTKLNSITTGSITMTYEETDNTISLNGALPTTDATGKKRLTEGEYFDFTVSSKIAGDVNINYEISAKDVTTSDRKIDGSNIKLYLTRLTDDGTEEELMTPETYNEESNANNFTGRPSGEMSLYTSSMNSSESNNYRLRMWVDEDYNPQGDGGNLTFSVQINVYGKDGEKGSDVPLTTQKILEDNELQEEKENMFNYASNGMQYGVDEANPEYITNGLYSREDEDGVSYYFRGNVENNNVQFGEYTSDYYVYDYADAEIYLQGDLESCKESISEMGGDSELCGSYILPIKLASAGDKMYWKIVRINGDGSLRLIYNGTDASMNNKDSVEHFSIGQSLYNLAENNPKYTGYTYDNGTSSFIKKQVEIWYNDTLGSNSVYDNKVVNGRFCSDSSNYHIDETLGINVFASIDRLGQALTNYSKSNAPTLKCPSTSENYGGSYKLKVGLITADEMVMAGESLGISSNSYLTNGNHNFIQYTMTPSSYDDRYSDKNPTIWGFYTQPTSSLSMIPVMRDRGAVRPVINVKVENGFVSGDGTVSNPYVLS